MFGVFALILRLSFTIRALALGVRARYPLGVACAVAHALLLLAASLHGLSAKSTTAPFAPFLAALPFSPAVVSFSVVVAGYVRAREVAAADEEKVHRRLGAWIPVVALDAGAIVILVMLGVLSDPF